MANALSVPCPAPDIETLLEQYYPDSEPVAVIGLACRFPEAADSEAFWQNLLDGRECSRRFSRQALLDAGLDAATVDAPDFVNVGTVLDEADAFDAALFSYSRQEAESMDPQQRLFLQTAWHALEHAGYAPRDVPHKTGVFGSARVSTYPGREPLRIAEVAQVRGLQSLMGNDKDYLATRVAYKLNLGGPALSVQTACSSSLVAVHLACESLRAGECDMAIAGGVALSFPQQAGYLHQPGMIFSPDGHCRPFDAGAQGTFPGNGVGVVTLRRLGDALRDGDPVMAVLRGSAVNNDGNRKVGYTAPSVAGQREVIREALMLARVDCMQIGLIEAHGTATPLGDPVELEALRGAFAGRHGGPRCALGSVKGNLGHLDTAAGIASLIKVVLAVERGMIPPSLHFRQANPALALETSPFHVPSAATPWTGAERLAGVSSFGIGGTNCHMIVAALPEALRANAACDDTPSGQGTLLLSAASDGALRRLAAAHAAAMRHTPPGDLAHTALHGRQLDLAFRLAVPLGEETAAALDAHAAGESDILLQTGHGVAGRQLWLFTGQGSHWPGMGRAMAEGSPAFAACLERCLAACDVPLDPPLREVMSGQHDALLERMDYAQPAIVAFGLAMAAHWQALGLEPDMVLGHSVGEYAAAVVAGHYSIEQIMPLVQRRGALMQQCAGGAMLAVFADEATLLPLAGELGLDLAVCNGPRHLVFSGLRDAIDALAAVLDTREIRHQRLSVAGAAHSALLDPILDAYQHATAPLHAAPGRLPLISTLLGTVVDADRLNEADYWRRHLREPVRHDQAVRCALDHGVGVCLELGPDASLTGIGRREAADRAHWIASARRQQPAPALSGLALRQLYAAGVGLPWQTLLATGGRKVHAPCYPFDRTRYWREAEPVETGPGTADDAALAAGRRVATHAAASLDLPRLQALYDGVTLLHAIYVDTLVQRCVGDAFAHGVSATGILRSGRLLPRHRQLLVRLLDACVEDGYYRRDGECYLPAQPVPHARRDTLLLELRSYCEGLDVIADTLARAGDSLYAMMSGQLEPVAVIFPDGASSGVEVLYQEFSFGRYFNQIAAGVVTGLMRERQADRRPPQPFRILEVGGGTGGTTAWLLPELAGQPALHYDFTDISPIFLRRAGQKFSDHAFIDYRRFDLQQDAGAQGFAAGDYDLIVAANVIHATQHVGRTLANLRPLLKAGGRLLMREITRPMRLFDFVFGPLVLPLHDQDARGGGLFLSTAHWAAQCSAAGFARTDWLPDDGSPTAQISEHILLARVAGGMSARLAAPGDSDPDARLGQALTRDGCYLADWSDCAGQHDAWQERLRQVSDVLSHRHGDGRPGMPADMPASAPDWLSQVRLHWQGAAFGQARLEIEGCDAAGCWRSLTGTAPQPGLPGPQPAPDTHYDWQWVPSGLAPVPDHGDFSLPDACAAMTDALQQAGFTFSSQAARILLPLDPASPSTRDMTGPLLEALADPARRPLFVITRAAWALRDGDRVQPAHRAAWGLLRVAAIEQPGRQIVAIDLALDADWAALPAAVGAAAGSCWIAMRDGQALQPRLALQTHMAPALPAGSLCSEGWHLVTGAFGGLGRISVEWLARQGATRIALLAPHAASDWPDFRHAVSSHHACQLRWLRCDVADPMQLAAALHELQADGGIDGVIHAAGRLDDVPLALLTPERLAPVLALKAEAAHQLHDWLLAHQGRYLLLYSSAAAALGAAGQGAHALASAYLDGLAQSAPAGSALTVISMAWGAWADVGHAADAALLDRLATDGMGALGTAEGLWHLEQAVMRGAPYRLAMRVVPQRLDPVRREWLGIATTAVSRPLPPASASASLPPPAGCDPHDTDALIRWLGAHVAAQLRLDDPAQLTPQRDLLQLGLDSLLFLELGSAVQRQFGIRLDAGSAYRELTLAGLARLIAASAPQADLAATAPLVHDAARRFDPFPLTPIQHAYWLGRTDLIDYGGVACHVVFEWDLQHERFELPRFERAWNSLIQRHDMLRMVIDADGRQRILPRVPDYRPQRHDLRALTPAQQETALAETRDALSSRVLPADRWPLFELVISEIDDRRYRLHMNLDLLLFDVQSFKVMMDDLAHAYHGDILPPLELGFRDYVLAEQARRGQPAWRASWRYWQDLLPQLPPAPRLPACRVRSGMPPTFTPCQARLPQADWQRLKTEWQAWGVTPSAALLTLFAHTLERWSRHPRFTLNLTFFNRRPDHPQVPGLIGDFTSVLLIDFDLAHASPLQDSIRQTQQRLWQHLAHSQVNGVELMRELGRGRAQNRQPLMPVVFTSMLGMSLDGQSIDQAMTGLLGDPVHVFTQTPQVWLDHQVMEINGELVFSWYCMDDVLADGTAAAMFDDYCALLRGLVAEPARMTRTGLVRQHEDGSLDDFPRQRWPLSERDADSPDLRTLEDLLCRCPGIARAAARPAADGRAIMLDLVADDSVPLITPAFSPLTPLLLPTLDPAQSAEVDATWTWLEARARTGITGTLHRHGLFSQAGQAHDVAEVHARLQALPQYGRLLRQWLAMLCAHGDLRREGDTFICLRPLQPQSGVAPLPQAGWSRTLGRYLETCIARHDALLTGTQSPLALLFDDDDKIARCLYSDNPVSDCLNRSATQLAAALAGERDDLRVLEVGAGTAATTRHLLPALAGRLHSYRFTDVSTLFLDSARQAFADRPEVGYALFDINRPVDYDAHADDGYDLIVAVNVLHDASHVVYSLRRLGRLLKPGGWLLLIEATERDSVLQMASIGFIESLNGYQDFRVDDDKPMLDLPQWRDALTEAGFALKLNWPEQERSPMRQHLVLARAEHVARLDTRQVERWLRAQPGISLPALQLRQCEQLPQGEATEVAAPGPGRATAVAQPALEAQVIAAWQSLLSQDICRDSDFFLCGGDSLIATRMVARLHLDGVHGASLQNLFAHPLLADFCATLQPLPASGSGDMPLLLASGRHAGSLFMFHASDGEVGAYLPLARRLDRQVFGLQATDAPRTDTLTALAAHHVAAIRRQQAHGPYALLGWSYGTFVAAEAARLLHEQGETVSLVLLDPVCREDFRCPDRTALLRLLAQGRIAVSLPDDLAQRDPGQQLACFLHNATAAGLLPAAPDPAQTHEWLQRIEHLLALLVRHPRPAPLPIPCLWLSAADRPAAWQPAGHDWQDWAAGAERHTLDGDHWQLVMDDRLAQQVATLFGQWRQHHEIRETA